MGMLSAPKCRMSGNKFPDIAMMMYLLAQLGSGLPHRKQNPFLKKCPNISQVLTSRPPISVLHGSLTTVLFDVGFPDIDFVFSVSNMQSAGCLGIKLLRKSYIRGCVFLSLR